MDERLCELFARFILDAADGRLTPGLRELLSEHPLLEMAVENAAAVTESPKEPEDVTEDNV